MSRYVIHRCGGSRDLARAAGRAWVEFIEANRAALTCSVALSGGRIAASLYESFVEDARARSLATCNLLFFWADERCVPPDHPDSNYRIAATLLFGPLGIKEARVRRIRGELPPEAAAAHATLDIRASLTGSPVPQLDLVLLGMGEDGHVASLFPEGTHCQKPEDIYCAVKGPKPPPDRVTLSYTMVAAAREVYVLVSGSGKQGALCQSMDPAGATPLARVLRSRKLTHLFVEEANFA